MIKIYEMTNNQIKKGRTEFGRRMGNKYKTDYFLKQLNDDEKREKESWSCRDMMSSILAYNCSPEMGVDRVVDILMNNEYIKPYITGIDGRSYGSQPTIKLGYDAVLEIAEDMAEDFCKRGKVHRNVFTDSEGLSYNALEYDDDED